LSAKQPASLESHSAFCREFALSRRTFTGPRSLRPQQRRLYSPITVLALALFTFLAVAGASGVAAAEDLADFLAKVKPIEVFPGADRYGAPGGEPLAAPVFKGESQIGYVFLNSDVVNSNGFSGKPIQILIGIDNAGVITGAKLVKHHEPIVLIGIPQAKIEAFIARYVGLNVVSLIKGAKRKTVDVVSGATVTVMVIDDSVVQSAIQVARAYGLGGLAPQKAAAAPAVRKAIDAERLEVLDWTSLLADGSIARKEITVGDVNAAFAALGNPVVTARPEPGSPDERFIELYAALASIPSVGRSLLGKNEYRALQRWLKPGDAAILIAGRGRFSFKGSGYVRGGIFDRIRIRQGARTFRFRDRDHRRLAGLAAAGAPKLKETDLFRIPAGSGFDPAQPWRLDLLVNRATGPTTKVFTSFSLKYAPPEKYLKTVAPPPVQVQAAAPAPAVAAPIAAKDRSGPPLWLKLWQRKIWQIAVLSAALILLTAIFFFQNWLARRPRLTDAIRIAFLVFTVAFIGFYAKAQLSVVNVTTFLNALITDFRWEYFLNDPLIFILWSAVAISLLFWGRGAYCGWLCPFGALQELLNRVAKALRTPQIRVPWGLHERLTAIKYIMFLGIFGVSLYSLSLAEKLAEVEPFKTAIILNFVRDWPFVTYAVALLIAGLFIERFYCRYLCVLGAALAIPGRMRLFEWLKRYRECGSPCQRCANECMVQAIHPEGNINPNECLYCLGCQMLYYDCERCPVMIQRRLKRERRAAWIAKDPTLAMLEPSALKAGTGKLT